MDKCILLVDDERDLVETISYRLQAAGYKVVSAYNGQEALEKVKEETFHLILLDIMMPGIDGFEVLRRLKSNQTTKYIPIIMLTCKCGSEEIFKSQDLGGIDYIIKPFDAQELLGLIKRYI